MDPLERAKEEVQDSLTRYNEKRNEYLLVEEEMTQLHKEYVKARRDLNKVLRLQTTKKN